MVAALLEDNGQGGANAAVAAASDKYRTLWRHGRCECSKLAREIRGNRTHEVRYTLNGKKGDNIYRSSMAGCRDTLNPALSPYLPT